MVGNPAGWSAPVVNSGSTSVRWLPTLRRWAKNMPKITAEEYPALKAFWVAWEDRFPPSATLPPEHHPVAVLERFEKESMSKARSGLGMAIGDTLEMSWDMPQDEVEAIDRDFIARGLLPLSELRRRYSRQFRALLKRGRIRDEEDYYLVAGILASFTGDATDEERQQLEDLVAKFESQAK